MTSVVCFSTADWDAPLWTNKQHLMARLADRGVEVLFIDSLGLRAPGVGAEDVRRIGRRLKSWRPFARPVRPQVRRDSPLVIPFYRYPRVRDVNRRLITMRVSRNARRWGLGRPIAWTYNPLAVDYLDGVDYRASVYHCVDDLSAYPGIDREAVRKAESRLVRRADVCIASSRPLAAHLEGLGANEVLYWPNPADVGAYAAVPRRERRGDERPVVGFIGAVQDHKIDVALLSRCAEENPEWRFEIVGPIGHGLASGALDVAALPENIVCPGVRPKEDLPEVLAGFDVGVIPYARNEYTAGVFPMKVFEYMAAGLPVVSTSLPSLVGEVDHIAFADDAESFSVAIRRAISTDGPKAEASRRKYAEAYSWEQRAEQAVELLRRLEG